MPLISIIIPTYNRAHLIGETLDSVLAQNYTNWECIVVDDGSSDNTAEVLARYVTKDSRFQYHIRPETHKSGGNGARNYGYTRSKGEFIQWLDSDDLLKETCLEGRLLFFEKDNELDIAVFSMGFYYNGFKTIDENRVVVNESTIETLRQFLCGSKLPWNVCRPFFKRKIIIDISFNEDLLAFQDDEYNIKILKRNPKYKSIDITDCYYRIDEDPNKLTSKESFLKIFPSLYEFYKSVFSILNKEELEDFEIGLINKFFGLVRYYHQSSKNNKTILKILQLFHKQYCLNFRTRFKFWSIIYLNSLWYAKRGHYQLTKQIDKL